MGRRSAVSVPYTQARCWNPNERYPFAVCRPMCRRACTAKREVRPSSGELFRDWFGHVSRPLMRCISLSEKNNVSRDRHSMRAVSLAR